MRLFAGLDLPDPVVNNLAALIERLRPAARIAWSPVANLHITTKFIGEWPPERLEELKAALAAVPRTGSIPIRIEGLGWFPNPHSPRIFLSTVRAPRSLPELANATGQALATLGVASETRPFQPHLTLARIKQITDLARMRHAVSELESVEFGEFIAQSFFLYSSQPDTEGPSVYTKLGEFPLT